MCAAAPPPAQPGGDGGRALPQQLGDLFRGIALIVIEIDDGPVFRWEKLHCGQKAALSGLGRGHLSRRIHLHGGPAPAALQNVLTGIHRSPDDPGLLMLPGGKGPGLLHQLQKNRLADILGVLPALEVGIAQAQDQIGIGLHQPLRLPAVQRWPHGMSHPFASESAFTYHTTGRAEIFHTGRDFFRQAQKSRRRIHDSAAAEPFGISRPERR